MSPDLSAGAGAAFGRPFAGAVCVGVDAGSGLAGGASARGARCGVEDGVTFRGKAEAGMAERSRGNRVWRRGHGVEHEKYEHGM
jgi:hypothetical protein